MARLTVYGCRGSTAAPEHACGLYGGNTLCLDMELSDGRRIVLDAGTGIRALGNRLIRKGPVDLSVILTHYHWDHVQGLPFFKPIWERENRIELLGPATGAEELASRVEGLMSGEYFPASPSEFGAHVTYRPLDDGTHFVQGVRVDAMRSNHPGHTLVYRLEAGGRSIVYAPDSEIRPEETAPGLTGYARRLAAFARGATLFIHDTMYGRSRYEQHRGWGHSTGESVAAVAVAAGVQRAMLFHHDPDHDDADVEGVHREFVAEVARRGGCMESEPAREGAVLDW